MNDTSTYKAIHLGLFASLVALCLAIFRGINQTFQNDAQGYVTEARGMHNGWVYMQENPGLFGHGFGFTGLIFLTLLVTNLKSLVLMKMLLVVGHGIAAYLVARIGIEIGLRERYWVSASIFFALDPFLIFAATDVQTESVTTLIVLWWCLLYISPTNGKIKPQLLLTIYFLSGAYLVLVKPNTLLPFTFLSIAMYFRFRNGGVSKTVFVFSVGLFLSVISLYHVFLFKLYSGFVFLSTAGGSSAQFMCRTEFIPQFLGFVSAAENERINAIGVQSTTSSDLLLANPTLTIPQTNKILAGIGLDTCLANPVSSIWVLMVKTFALWRPFTVFGAYGMEVFIFSLLLWLPLTLVTIWFLFNKQMSTKCFLLKKYFVIISIGFTLSLLLTPTQIRHRVAFAEPFYWLFFFYFLQIAIATKSKRRSEIQT